MTILSSFITINVDILACESKEEFSFGIELWPRHTTTLTHTKRRTERFSVSYMRYVRLYDFAYKGDTLMNISMCTHSTLIHKQHTHTRTHNRHIQTHLCVYAIRYIDLIVVISYYIGINFISSFFFPPNKSAAFCLLAHIPPIHPSLFPFVHAKCRMRMSLR